MLVAATLALATLPKITAETPLELGQIRCHPRRLMVGVGNDIPFKSIQAAGARILRYFPEIGVATLETPPNRLVQTRDRLLKLPGIEFVDFDRAARTAYTPNDPRWPEMWHFPAIKVDEAWDLTFGGSNAIVAVLDTGVDTDHPDLAANMWVNPGEIAGNGLDDDGNGYVDDVHGYDFAYEDPEPNDVHGHGTACAGLVAAVMDNGIGVTGVAPRARIMAMKIATDNGYFYDSANIPGYLYAADHGARIFSMSFFSDRVSRAERRALEYAVRKGVLPVAAAGNDYTVLPYYPAAYDFTLSVAAIGPSGAKTSWSNFGALVDVAAPGTGLRTTTTGGGYTSSFGGTSGACPHVAGLAALLLGDRPQATGPELRRAIEDSATPVNQAPFGEFASYGLVNSAAAVRAIRGETMPVKPPIVRFITVCSFSNADVVTAASDVIKFQRFQGRGLDGAPVEVKAGTQTMWVGMQNRERVDAEFEPPHSGRLQLRHGSELLVDFLPPFDTHPLQLFTEASAPGGTVQGGFREALHPDGKVVRATPGFGGRIDVQIPLRLVQAEFGWLKWLRRVTATGGTERIWVYDWSSQSYPYGSWVLLREGPAPEALTWASARMDLLKRWVDPEGVIYLRLEVSGLPTSAELELDTLHMRILR